MRYLLLALILLSADEMTTSDVITLNADEAPEYLIDPALAEAVKKERDL